jgi:hypothetical protein
MIQALEIAGYDKDFPKILPCYRQPEDKLTYFIKHDERVLKFWKELDPNGYNAWALKKGDYNEPNEVHAVLSYATNLFMGKKVTEFSASYPLDNLVSDIMIRQKPCVLSGKFSNLNHVVTLVGLVFNTKLYNKKIKNKTPFTFKDVKFLIVDDTYGYTGNYRSGKSGNDVLITPDRFKKEFKPFNAEYKWCHRIL